MKKKNNAAFVTNLTWQGANLRKLELKDVGKTIKAAKQSQIFDKEKYTSKSAEIVSNVALGVLSAARKGKILDKYVEVAKVGTSLLTGATKSEIVISHNNNYIRNNKTMIKKSIIHIGRRGRGMLINPPAFHSKNDIQLINTDTDAIEPYRRQETVSQIGFSQRRVDIFLNDTFMTIGNIKELISFEDEIEELKNDQKRKISRVLRKEITGEKRTLKQKTREYFNRVGKVKKYALISRLKTLLKISSDTEAYNSKVIIHICTFKDLTNCTIPIEKIICQMTEEHLDATKNGLRRDQIIKDEIRTKTNVKKQESPLKFKKSLALSIDARISDSDALYDNVAILKTLNRTIGPGDRVDLTVYEHFEKGISLNLLQKLHEDPKNESDFDSFPIGCFFIIEHFGDKRAKLVDKKSGSKYNGYSPSKIRYDLKSEVKYVCNNKTPDEPLIHNIKGKNKDFEESDLANDWYPDREISFNIDIEDIDINGSEDDKNYQLQLDNETVGLNRIDELNQYLKKINKEPITEDDEPFLGRAESTLRDNLTNVKERLGEKLADGLINKGEDVINNLLSDSDENEAGDDE